MHKRSGICAVDERARSFQDNRRHSSGGDFGIIVSIIIRNYNYGEFLKDAIDSALAQSAPRVQVIVVDDGSDDRSHQIIESYEGRIVALFHERNLGEGAAVNTGFTHAAGEIVIYLDADDVLASHAVDEIIAHWTPDVARVHYKLEAMDKAGQPLGHYIPPYEIPEGSFEDGLRAFGHSPSGAQSGNAYSAWALRKILPLDAGAWLRGPDAYLNTLTSCQGPAIYLREVLGGYRFHDRNCTFRNIMDLSFNNNAIMIHVNLKNSLSRFFKEHNLPDVDYSYPFIHLCYRIISLRLNRSVTRVTYNELFELTVETLRALWRKPFTPPLRKMALFLWVLLSVTAPSSILKLSLPLAFALSRRLQRGVLKRTEIRGGYISRAGWHRRQTQ